MAASQISLRHFGRKAVATLARKGITITGLQAAQGSQGFLNSTTDYVVNDNGCGRVWTRAEVLGAAA